MIKRKTKNGKARTLRGKPRSGGDRNSGYANRHSNVVSYSPRTFGFPLAFRTDLRYCDTSFISSTAGSVGTYGFRINSTFDPDFTSTGHQPLFRDVFAGIYDQYAVISARAVIEFQNSSANPFLVGVVIDDDNSPSGTLTLLQEQNLGEHAVLTQSTGSESKTTFIVEWRCKDVLNIDPYTSMAYKTAVGSNPTETSFLWLYASDLATGTNNVNFNITLEQEVLWTELATPSGS